MGQKHRAIARTFETCLQAVDAPKRAELEKIRRQIRSLVPEAEEGVSYGLAAFRLRGRPLAALGAGAHHCAFYPMSGEIVSQFKKELAAFETSKGTIRFSPEQPLPPALVKKLIKARIAELAPRSSQRTSG